MAASTDTQSGPELRRTGPPRLARAGIKPRLWAVGGGKGGVGKSVVTSSLGVALARRGRRCVLVDADLGSANLHTLLGVEGSRRSLSEFLNGEATSLDRVACPTRQPSLSLISGAQALLGMANPAHSRKLKLTRHLEKLDADDVLLDLAAGTAFNVLDFFVAADRGILVLQPEPTSIENAYAFLKAAFFRSLRPIARQANVRLALERALTGGARRLQSPREFIENVTDIDPVAGQVLRERAEAFSPLLIVNGVRTQEDRDLGAQIAATCRTFLGTRVAYLGALDWDEVVLRAVRLRRPVPSLSFSCPFWAGVEEIADQLLRMDLHASHPELGEPPQTAEPDSALRPTADLALPGAYLKRCRERLGLSLDEAIHQTRIRQLEQIESESFDRLPPEEPYLEGLVLLYARALRAPRPEAIAVKYLERYRCAQRWAERPPIRVAG